MAGHGRGPKQNNRKNHQAHEEWVRRKKLGILDPARLPVSIERPVVTDKK